MESPATGGWVFGEILEDVGLDVDFSYNLGGKWGLMTVAQDSYSTAAPGESTRAKLTGAPSKRRQPPTGRPRSLDHAQ